jgi:hypothetical protein
LLNIGISDGKFEQKWTSTQVTILLDELLNQADSSDTSFTESTLLALDEIFHFTDNENAEIKLRWQRLCLESDVEWCALS